MILCLRYPGDRTVDRHGCSPELRVPIPRCRAHNDQSVDVLCRNTHGIYGPSRCEIDFRPDVDRSRNNVVWPCKSDRSLGCHMRRDNIYKLKSTEHNASLVSEKRLKSSIYGALISGDCRRKPSWLMSTLRLYRHSCRGCSGGLWKYNAHVVSWSSTIAPTIRQGASPVWWTSANDSEKFKHVALLTSFRIRRRSTTFHTNRQCW